MNNRRHPDEDRREHNAENETFSATLEKGQEFMEKWSERDDKKVIHCPKCHGAEKAQRMSKATMVFSLGAFVMSLAALLLPFFKTSEAGFSAEQWETFLTTLQDGMKVSEQVKPPTAARPVATPPKSSAPAKPASSAAAPASSVPADTSSAAGEAAATEPAADGTR